MSVCNVAVVETQRTTVEGAGVAASLREMLHFVRGRSPLYERLLAGLAGAAERGFDGGVIGRLLAAASAPTRDESRLLVLTCLHHAALSDPELPHAEWFPTARGSAARNPDDGAPAALALAWLVEHEEEARAFVSDHRLQTNEPGRSAALLPGFCAAAAFGTPLRLLELGTSAGFHLRFDRYRYRYTDGPTWGPSVGPVLESRAEGDAPRALSPPTVEIAERRGVDLAPIDATSAEGLRLLHAFLWPDEPELHERLDRAAEVVRTTPARIERGDLVEWADQHAHPVAGTTTVLFHSQVRHFLDAGAVSRLAEIAERGLRAATPAAPFAYVSFEPPRGMPADRPSWPEVTVALSDGSRPPDWRTLVASDWHGTWVRWF